MSVEIAAFAAFAASQVGTPGPANMALLATGAGHGLRAALPFVAGVALGKQLLIWPLGFGLMGVLTAYPLAYGALKWASAAYICYLAWRVANLRLATGQAAGQPAGRAPGFAAGLIVHPLNPKAWGMITAGFTNFTAAGTPPLEATAVIAICFLTIQAALHPLWCWGGAWIAARLAGTANERYLMWALAGATVLSVLLVLF